MNKNLTAKNIFITGGSSGIGLAVAKYFGARGFNVLITSIDLVELDEALHSIREVSSDVMVDGFLIDLSKDGSTALMYDTVIKTMPEPDIVVNNAGFGTYGFIDDINMKKEEEMIHLMVMNLYQSSRLFLSKMLKINKGCIINISSISAFQPNPTLSTYGACKAFVYQWTRSVSEELKSRKSAVRCLVICPTPVRTNFQKGAGMEKSLLFDSWMTVNPDMVAKDIYRAYNSGMDYIIPGKIFHFLAVITKRFPERLLIWMAKNHLKEKSK